MLLLNSYHRTMRIGRVFVIALAAITVPGGNALTAGGAPRVTDMDRVEIINQMLSRQLEGKTVNETDDLVSDFELLMQAKGGIVLSTRNLRSYRPRPIPSANLVVLTPHEIQTKADRQGDFMYLVFIQFQTKGATVVVTLARTWAKSKTSQTLYMSGGAETYQFRREGAKWVGTFVQGYII